MNCLQITTTVDHLEHEVRVRTLISYCYGFVFGVLLYLIRAPLDIYEDDWERFRQLLTSFLAGQICSYWTLTQYFPVSAIGDVPSVGQDDHESSETKQEC